MVLLPRSKSCGGEIPFLKKRRASSSLIETRRGEAERAVEGEGGFDYSTAA